MVQNIPTGGPTASPSLRATHKVGPVGPVVINPAPVGEPPDNQPHSGRRRLTGWPRRHEPIARIGRRVLSPIRGCRIGHHIRRCTAVEISPARENRGAVAGAQECRVHKLSAGVHRQRFGFFPQKINSTRCGIEVVGVKHQQTFIGRARNVGSFWTPREDNIARLIEHWQHRRGHPTIQIDHRH